MDHDTAVKSYAVERYFLCDLSEAESDAYEEHFFSCQSCAHHVRLVFDFIHAARAVIAEARKAKMKVSDLKSYGGVLLCPGEPGFEAAVDLAVGGNRSNFVTRIKDVSVVLQNTATKTIIGYSVNWEYKSLDGKTSRRGVVRDEPAALLHPGLREEAGRTDISNSRSIGPGGALLVSVFTGVGRSEPEITRFWRTEYLEEITSVMDRSQEVTAILDGIMFEDGTFAGPNKNRLFERVVAAFDSVQSFYRHIIAMADSCIPEADLVSWARAQTCDAMDVDCGSSGPVDPERMLLDRSVAAENFVRVYANSDLIAAVDHARSKLYHQRPAFVNLGC